jgi:PiT family inorganic phosphate transporter
MMENTISKVALMNSAIEDKLICQLIKEKLTNVRNNLDKVHSFDSLKQGASLEIRKDIIVVSREVNNLLSPKYEQLALVVSKEDKHILKRGVSYLKTYTEYTPWWVIVMISMSLGLGTMIGWKRIVITVGEKIGKTPLSYAQGASANLVAAGTIGLSTLLGLPVSTTHVLSSGVGGSMVATKGIKNLRMKTVRSILVAWLITLPVTIVLSGAIFLLFRFLFK